jgi:hypothetical protein
MPINFVECYGINIKLDRICNKIVINVKAGNKSLKYFFTNDLLYK